MPLPFDFSQVGTDHISTPQVTVANDGHLGDDGPGGIMQQEDSLYADANMVDAGGLYGEGDTLGDAPYYGVSQVDPDISRLLDDDMANIDLQAGPSDVSPGQAYTGDVSSTVLTPPTKPKRTLSKRNKKGKQKQAFAAEDSEMQIPSEEEGGADVDVDAEQPEDESDEFAPEPVAAKKSPKKTPSRRKSAAPRTPKSGTKTPSKARMSATKSTGKSASKALDEIPFNRQRRVPKNGITEARPIARCYDECDEADKMVLDLREKELKPWKEIRVVWEEMTGRKSGVSTLPNRYE